MKRIMPKQKVTEVSLTDHIITSAYAVAGFYNKAETLSQNRLQTRYVIAYVCAKKHDEQSLQQYQTKEINPYFLARGFAEGEDYERVEVIYKQSSPGIKNDIAYDKITSMKFKSELEEMITLAYIEGGYFVEQASGRFIFKFLENKELQNTLFSELYSKSPMPFLIIWPPYPPLP